MSVALAAPGVLPFAVEFGCAATAEIPRATGVGLTLQLPVLGGVSRETIFSGVGDFRSRDGLNLWSSGEKLIGWTSEKIANEPELVTQTLSLYRRVLSAANGRHLYRIWNYLSRINATTDGLENYRAFCRGRSLAFEEACGDSFSQVLPSASAVGTEDGTLSLVFVAGATLPRHVENPEQLPAYRYPMEHGPRSPSFSRATVVETGGRRFTFISGTSSIKGHATVAPGSLPDQLDCTLDNLRLVAREAGAGDQLISGEIKERHFKIYLRHTHDYGAAKKYLERELLCPTDVVTYLQADICRPALNVEIEATLIA